MQQGSNNLPHLWNNGKQSKYTKDPKCPKNREWSTRRYPGREYDDKIKNIPAGFKEVEATGIQLQQEFNGKD